MPVWASLAAAGVGLLGAALLVPVARGVGLRYGWVDVPDGQRKAHGAPVAVTGGWAVLVGLGTAVLVAPAGSQFDGAVWAGAAGVFGLGWVEDAGRRRGRSFAPLVRLAVQVVVVAAVASTQTGTLLGWVALTGWIVLLMNAVNLVDGLDGLAAGVAAIAAGGLALAALVGGGGGDAAALWGVLVGYLALALRPGRRVFLGDSGSLVLGYLLATITSALARQVLPGPQALAVYLMSGVFVVEVLVTVVRRWRSGRTVWHADADHLHHRLARADGPPAAVRTVWWFGKFFACLGVAAFALPDRWAVAAVGAAVAGGALLARDLYAVGRA